MAHDISLETGYLHPLSLYGEYMQLGLATT
jgi:hypothetical protein